MQIARTPRGLARNTSWMMAGLGLRLGAQAAYFVLIARALGADGYGAFIGVVAMVAIAAPFASWGSGNLLIKHVARRPESFPVYWGRALLVAGASGGVLTVMVLGVGYLVLPSSIPLAAIAAIAMSDLVFGRLIDLAGQAFQAFERLDRTAMIQVLPAVGKLTLAGVLVAGGADMTVTRWSVASLLATAVAAVAATSMVRSQLGRATRPQGSGWELREGFLFSISLSAQTVYNDIDKTMLVRLATLGAAGIYGAAYRVIDVAITPLRSLLSATYARFFRHGEEGLAVSLRYARRLLPVGVAYGLVVAGMLWLAAPVLTAVLGDGFAEVEEALRWLALLPLLKVLSYVPADAMTGADRQGSRSAIQVAVAVLNVVLCIWLIPTYTWRGAAWASLISDGVLAAALWVAAVRLASSRQPTSPVPILEPSRA